jgi:hypothetical protein
VALAGAKPQAWILLKIQMIKIDTEGHLINFNNNN